MGAQLENKEEGMKCATCGADLKGIATDLPFKIGDHSIVIIKNLPVLQCSNCSDYLLEDNTMARVDELLKGIDAKVEVEILQYAA
jgi:YgiT-type zinc finger domain-containing protein